MVNWEYVYKEKGIVQREIMPVVSEFVKMLAHQKHKNLKILDSGCGTGRHTIFIVDSLKDNLEKIESIDSSEKAIQLIKTLIKKHDFTTKVNVRIHNLNNTLPYSNDYFDGIISTLVIEHGMKKEILKWCNDMDRVLKSGGLLALAVPSTDDPRYLTGKEIEDGTKINTKQIDGDIPHHFFIDKEIESTFKNYKILYKKLQSRPSATADVIAKHWEYVLEKP